MGLGRCQSSIIVVCAPTTHANSPTYTTIPRITMPRPPSPLAPSLGNAPSPPYLTPRFKAKAYLVHRSSNRPSSVVRRWDSH